MGGEASSDGVESGGMHFDGLIDCRSGSRDEEVERVCDNNRKLGTAWGVSKKRM